MDIKQLEPAGIWKNFSALNAVPRPSKKEEKVIAFIEAFGKQLGLPTTKDSAGNVIIKKPATPGMENRKTIVLQSHLDMVHQKNADTKFDFNSEGIKMLVDGDWVKADGTTLGADNGIGVASIMTILESTDIPHPAIEALFTIDEETGMTGALALQGGLLDAEILLNLDTEEDNELTIGCAGGIDVTANAKYTETAAPSNSVFYKLSVKGLRGGHSGMEIHKGLGNANKIMNRILLSADNSIGIYIHSIDGGGLRNAIPRESFSVVGVDTSKAVAFENAVDTLASTLKNEYATTDPDLQVVLEKVSAKEKVFNSEFQQKILRAIYACPNGIYRMSPDIPDLVQTSNNVARVVIQNGEASVQCLCRSSVNTEKEDEVMAITSAFQLADCTITSSGSYPGWQPSPHSEIVNIMSALYTEIFKGNVHVNACHAGLECGILGRNYPHMDMISFGPTIRGAHSPDERVQISSVQKFWKYLLETLTRIPVKK